MIGLDEIIEMDTPPKTTSVKVKSSSFQEQVKALFDQLEQIDTQRERSAFIKQAIDPVFDQCDVAELTKDTTLLRHAVEKQYRSAIDCLIERTQDWPQETVKELIFESAEAGNITGLSRLLPLVQDDRLKVLKQLDSNRDKYGRDIGNTINSHKAAYLGYDWKVLNDHEISKTTSCKTATIERVFNFNAMSVTTITSKDKNIIVSEKNFEDCQADGDIEAAHQKLSVFGSPPAYLGKDYKAPRTVKRRFPNAGK